MNVEGSRKRKQIRRCERELRVEGDRSEKKKRKDKVKEREKETLESS